MMLHLQNGFVDYVFNMMSLHWLSIRPITYTVGLVVDWLLIDSQNNISLFHQTTSRRLLSSKDLLDAEKTHLGVLVAAFPTLNAEA